MISRKDQYVTSPEPSGSLFECTVSGSKCETACFVSNTLVCAVFMAGLFKVFPLEACHSASFALFKEKEKNIFNFF